MGPVRRKIFTHYSARSSARLTSRNPSLRAAARRGRTGGRPRALDEAKLRAAKALLASGSFTASEVARQVGCAPSTLYRHLPGGRSALGVVA